MAGGDELLCEQRLELGVGQEGGGVQPAVLHPVARFILPQHLGTGVKKGTGHGWLMAYGSRVYTNTFMAGFCC